MLLSSIFFFYAWSHDLGARCSIHNSNYSRSRSHQQELLLLLLKGVSYYKLLFSFANKNLTRVPASAPGLGQKLTRVDAKRPGEPGVYTMWCIQYYARDVIRPGRTEKARGDVCNVQYILYWDFL